MLPPRPFLSRRLARHLLPHCPKAQHHLCPSHDCATSSPSLPPSSQLRHVRLQLARCPAWQEEICAFGYVGYSWLDASRDQPADALLMAENNPEVMSSLVHRLGLSQNLAFHDVFSIDEPELLAFVPRPAHALLLVFPVSETYEKFRIQEDKDQPEYQGHGPDEEVVWYKQTIGNACGLIGLLHGVSNGAARSHIGTL